MMIRQLPSARRGFTMIELLVVITIISILLAATLYAVGNAIGVARARATEATLVKLDSLLRGRIEAFGVNLKKPTQTKIIERQMAVVNDTLRAEGVPTLPTAVLELLARKSLFQQAFPQTLGDNVTLGAVGNYFNGNAQNAAESSEYLYWILTQADSYGMAPPDSSEFSASEIGDTDGDGRLEFLDAWGNPLLFYRWPTRLLRPGGATSPVMPALASLQIGGLPSDNLTLSKDPGDGVNLYSDKIAEQMLPPEIFEKLFHTPRTYYVPLILSAGPDRESGLYQPHVHDDSTPIYGNLAQPLPATLADPSYGPLLDNITNHKKQD